MRVWVEGRNKKPAVAVLRAARGLWALRMGFGLQEAGRYVVI
jgi:hypothetical protein